MCCCSGIWRCQFPDLNQLDFYLWDDIICEVYNNEIQNQEELVDYMEGSATLIQKSPGIFEHIRQLLLQRATACIEDGGQNFQHLLKNQ